MATTAQQSKTSITSGQRKLTRNTILLKSGGNITRHTDRKSLTIPKPDLYKLTNIYFRHPSYPRDLGRR